ncbi:MAG: 4Fe-4S dicluster domain-containing protein [Pirellulaceae bacterium]
MASTTALLAYDFYYFREQTCLIACPYGRLQSVMLDPQSLIVAYDYTRGAAQEGQAPARGQGGRLCRLQPMRGCLPNRNRYSRRPTDGVYQLYAVH